MTTDLVLAVFTAVEGAHAFSAFMPSYFTVKKFAASKEDLEALRSGYSPAIAFNLLLGGSVSLLTKDVRPFVVSIVVVAFMMYLYENALKTKITKSEDVSIVG